MLLLLLHAHMHSVHKQCRHSFEPIHTHGASHSPAHTATHSHTYSHTHAHTLAPILTQRVAQNVSIRTRKFHTTTSCLNTQNTAATGRENHKWRRRSIDSLRFSIRHRQLHRCKYTYTQINTKSSIQSAVSGFPGAGCVGRNDAAGKMQQQQRDTDDDNYKNRRKTQRKRHRRL